MDHRWGVDDGLVAPRRAGASLDGVRRLSLLGRLAFWDGTAEIPLFGSAGSVVAMVALSPNPIERSVLAGTIWADVDERRAFGNLRSTLWRLKKGPPLLVELRSGTLSIDPGVAVDYHEVAAWADRLIRGRPNGEDLDSLPSPSEHELLPGRYDDWIVFERERFRQRVLHATENLARVLAQRGRFAEAIEAALAAIAADPLRESAHRVAIECHLAEHNLVEARRQQLSYVRMLRTDLGIEPSTGFMRLVPRSFADTLAEPFDEPLANLTQRVLR